MRCAWKLEPGRQQPCRCEVPARRLLHACACAWILRWAHVCCVESRYVSPARHHASCSPAAGKHCHAAHFETQAPVLSVMTILVMLQTVAPLAASIAARSTAHAQAVHQASTQARDLPGLHTTSSTTCTQYQHGQPHALVQPLTHACAARRCSAAACTCRH
jgi:hypothetical protein